jgi:hypothetical protein
MIVHFIAGKTNIEQNIKYLRQIVTTIYKSGHVLARDWVEPAYILQTGGMKRPVDWQEVFRENIESLNKADVLIAETTEKSFGVGYQVALAAQQKKPILLLQRKEVAKESFANGLVLEDIRRMNYDEKNVEATIEKFLKDNDIKAKDMRFNFFIDRPIYNYLRWAAFKSGKTKAEILRELVTKEIDSTNY